MQVNTTVHTCGKSTQSELMHTAISKLTPLTALRSALVATLASNIKMLYFTACLVQL